MCAMHYGRWYYHQNKKKGTVKMKKGFSTERYCSLCDTVKDWKQYYLDMKMCRDCYRERIREEFTLNPDGTKARKNSAPKETADERLQDLLDYIATIVQS